MFGIASDIGHHIGMSLSSISIHISCCCFHFKFMLLIVEIILVSNTRAERLVSIVHVFYLTCFEFHFMPSEFLSYPVLSYHFLFTRSYHFHNLISVCIDIFHILITFIDIDIVLHFSSLLFIFSYHDLSSPIFTLLSNFKP